MGKDIDLVFREASDSVKKFAERLKIDISPLIAGDGEGNVDVPDKEGWIFGRNLYGDVLELKNPLGYTPQEGDWIVATFDPSKLGPNIPEIITADVAAVMSAGIAGDGEGNVYIPGHPDWVWVRWGIGEVEWEARNPLGYNLMDGDPIYVVKHDIVAAATSSIVYGQVMFYVAGTLSAGDDVAPWFICSAPNGVDVFEAILVVKTAPGGGPVICDVELSTDCGGSWASIFTVMGVDLPTIPNGDNCSPVLSFVRTLWVEQGSILKLNNDEVNGAMDLTASLRVRQR